MESKNKAKQLAKIKNNSQERIQCQNSYLSIELPQETTRNYSRPSTTFKFDFSSVLLPRPETAKSSLIIHSKLSYKSTVKPLILEKNLKSPSIKLKKLYKNLEEKVPERSNETSKRLFGISTDLPYEPLNSFSVRSIKIESPTYNKSIKNFLFTSRDNLQTSKSVKIKKINNDIQTQKSLFRLKNNDIVFEEKSNKKITRTKLPKKHNKIFSKIRTNQESVEKNKIMLNRNSPLVIRQLKTYF